MAKSGDVSKHATGVGIWPLPILGRDGMLLVLTWAAGSVDAISYLGLGHVFTAMMTGNTVLLGLAIGQGQVLAALRSVIALAGVCLGAAVRAFIVEREAKREGLLAAVFLAYGLGALASTILQARSSSLVALLPLVAVAIVVVNASSLHWRRQDRSSH